MNSPTPEPGTLNQRPSRPTPQFIYFDLGNVLLHFDHPKAARQMAALAGMTQAEVWSIVFDSDLEVRYERGEIDCRAFYDEFCRRTNSAPDFAALKHAAAEIFEPNHAVIDLVNRLKGHRHRLGVLSNTCAAHWEYCIDGRYPFLNECFETYALSYELKSMKPDQHIYTRAAELAGLPPQHLFFVDDRPENVAGARAAGYDAVEFNSAAELEQQLRDRRLLA